MKSLVLPQLDGSQIIAHIVLRRACASPRSSHHSRFRVAVRNAYRQRLQHEFHVYTTGCALSNDYLKACESVNRAVVKCISRCVILPIFET